MVKCDVVVDKLKETLQLIDNAKTEINTLLGKWFKGRDFTIQYGKYRFPFTITYTIQKDIAKNVIKIEGDKLILPNKPEPIEAKELLPSIKEYFKHSRKLRRLLSELEICEL